MLAAAAAAAVFACGRRPGPAGQSSSSRSLAAAGLLEWQASRSAAWSSNQSFFSSKQGAPKTTTSHRRTQIEPHHHHGHGTDTVQTATPHPLPLLYIHGPHHTSTEGNGSVAGHCTGRDQSTAWLSFSLKRARQQSRLRQRIMWLHYTTSCHTYYAGPTVSFDHELKPDGMRFQFLLSSERPKQNSDCW